MVTGPVGAAGRFVRVSDSDPAMLRYLAEHGITLGMRLEVVDRQPFGGPVFVRFGEREHPIGGGLARAMRITTAEAGPDAATGTVTFKNEGEPKAITLDLKKTKAGWRIDDIHWPDDQGSFRKLLGGS